MLEKEQAIQALADRLERLDAPLSLPEDWTILCDDDDLRHMSRVAAKALLATAKKETARRWLYARFDPTDMDLEFFEDSECSDDTQVFDDKLLKQRALNSIDDVVSTVTSLRNTYASDLTQPLARQATAAARAAYGYPEERPDRTDCFDEDVRRQCRRIINKIYSSKVKSSGPVVYLISTDNPEFVKIGYTTCLERRLKSLGTASHVEPTIHLTIEGRRSLERELHTRFEAARYSREWFRLTDDIKTFIASAGSSEARDGDASTL
ncbi:hypothetical protein ACVWZR_002386 [Bradyrhizobium sp. i1.3.1]